jgi:hypothetical protein
MSHIPPLVKPYLRMSSASALLSRGSLTPEGQVFYEENPQDARASGYGSCHSPASGKGRNWKARHRPDRSSYLYVSARSAAEIQARYPGVALHLEENVPRGQDLAVERGEIDIGFTRTLSADRHSSLFTRVILHEPLLLALSRARKVKAKRIRIADLASERFVIFQRTSAPRKPSTRSSASAMTRAFRPSCITS